MGEENRYKGKEEEGLETKAKLLVPGWLSTAQSTLTVQKRCLCGER